MGGRGAKIPKSTETAKGKTEDPKKKMVGKSVKELYEYSRDVEQIKKDFGIELTSRQEVTLSRFLRGIAEHDRSYDTEHVPFDVKSFDITSIGEKKSEEEKAKERELYGKVFEVKDVIVSLTTVPRTDNALIRMWDTKRRQFIIGERGGAYIYTDKGKQKRLDMIELTVYDSEHWEGRK